MAQKMRQGSTVSPTSAGNSVMRWLRQNLFNSWLNSVLTLLAASVIVLASVGFLQWAFGSARWAVIPANLKVLLVGIYPSELLWRIWTAVLLLMLLVGFSGGRRSGLMRSIAWGGTVCSLMLAAIPFAISTRVWLVAIAVTLGVSLSLGWSLRACHRRWLRGLETTLWILSFPIAVVLVNGVGGALPIVEGRTQWGFLLNLLGAVAGIGLSLPIGVLLALGRRSKLPVIRWVCTAYIELIRGVPLISLLFMASIMLQLLLPDHVRPDLLVRAMVTIILFASAYMAENVRGGLQSIPKGQIEAAQALGLGGFLTTTLIILPQALRAVLPAIVGQFIALFKDTTLFGFIAILEVLSLSRSVVGNIAWRGTIFELYVFIGILFWVLCYGLSVVGRRIERRLGSGDR